jgi:hypothetical protein
MSANMEICFLVNLAVAICYAPTGSDTEQAKLADSSAETFEPLPVPDQMAQLRHGTAVNTNEALQLQSELPAMDSRVLHQGSPVSTGLPQGCHTELQTNAGSALAVTGSSDIRVAAPVALDSSLGVETAATPYDTQVCTRRALSRTQTADIELGLKASAGSLESSKHTTRTTSRLVIMVVMRVLTNIPLLFQTAGLVWNVAGLKLPGAADELFEAIGQPFGVLFFIVIGMNLSWATIRNRARKVLVMIPTRILIHGLLMLIVWLLPVLQEGYVRKAAFIALCCPIGGITMAYTMDYGFDGGLQAAMMSVSNIISFALLLAAINL